METSTDTIGYTFKAENVAYFRQMLKKLNKRATKLALPEVLFRITGRDKKHEPEGVQWYTHVEVLGTSPRLSGWSIAAVIEHTPGGNIVRDATDGRLDMSVYRYAYSSECDHCNTKRVRKETVVLEHTDGRIVRVGKSCLKDYLGGASVEQLLWYANFHTALGSVADESEGHSYGYAPDGAPLVEYLSWVALCIRKFGWVSRTVAKQRDDAFSTADDALTVMYDKPPRGIDKEYPTSEDADLAEAAYAWLKDDLASSVGKGLNDYQHNLHVILNNDWTTRKQAGYAASIVSGYQKHLERKVKAVVKAQVQGESHYVGVVGKREVFDVIVGFTRELPGGNFGPTYLVTFTTLSGAVLKWFASRNPKWDPGRHVALKATVKKHGEYLNVKETTVSRCVIQEA